jgi:transcriptional regulator
MHVPDKWRITDNDVIYDLVEQNAFATLVSPSLQASRLPLLLDREKRLLIGHFSRSNPHWKEVAEGKHLAMFDVAHDYISPTWYQGMPNVPTWNYVSIHIKGKIKLLSSQETRDAVLALVRKYEPSLLDNTQMMPNDYQDRLSKGIVGFTMSIDEIEAKAKLGQHRKAEDQKGVAQGLSKKASQQSQALLKLKQQLGLGLGE